MKTVDMRTASADTFRPYVDQTFTLCALDGAVICDVTLQAVKLGDANGIRDTVVTIDDVDIPPRHPFSLTWIGPKDPMIAQSMVKMKHSDIEDFEIFLSPFAQDPDAVLYESVLN